MRMTRELWETICAVLMEKQVSQRRFLDYFGAQRGRDLPGSRLVEVLKLAMNPPAEWKKG